MEKFSVHVRFDVDAATADSAATKVRSMLADAWLHINRSIWFELVSVGPFAPPTLKEKACAQCGRIMGPVAAAMGPICGGCARENHERMTGRK